MPQLIDPNGNASYCLDGLVPVERLGLYLYRAVDIDHASQSATATLSSIRSEAFSSVLLKKSVVNNTSLVTSQSTEVPQHFVPTTPPRKGPETSSRRSHIGELAGQFVICRVAVAGGQKELTVQSQVIVKNQISSLYGLEISVNIVVGGSSARPRILIPPFGSGAVPIFGTKAESVLYMNYYCFIIVYMNYYCFLSMWSIVSIIPSCSLEFQVGQS